MFQQAEIYFGGSRFGRPSGARFRFPSRFKQLLVSILGKFRGHRNSPVMDPISGPKNGSSGSIFGPQKWVHFWAPEMGSFLGPRNRSLKSVPTKNKKGPKLGPKNWSKFGPQKQDPKNQKNDKSGPQN